MIRLDDDDEQVVGDGQKDEEQEEETEKKANEEDNEEHDEEHEDHHIDPTVQVNEDEGTQPQQPKSKKKTIAPQEEIQIHTITKFKSIENIDLDFTSIFYCSRVLEVEKLKGYLSKDCNHGLTGLKNLGNSCYINSVIQCLSHTLDLTYYFLSKTYAQEINVTSNSNLKTGLKPGQITLIFYKILFQLWSGCDKTFVPSELRYAIANAIPFFNNTNQHDASEYLLSLMDLLHEDLNQAPIANTGTQMTDCQPKLDNESDISASKRFWKHFSATNQSIIVDLFYGQLKNSVSCLVCGHKEITFDTFFTLPLAIPNLKRVDVVIVPAINLRSTIKFPIYVSDSALFIDMGRYLNKSIALAANGERFEKFRILLYNGQTNSARFVKMSDNIYNTSKKGNLFVYEIDEKSGENDEFYPFIALVKSTEMNDLALIEQSSQILSESATPVASFKNFSYPRIFAVNAYSKVKALRMSIYGHMRKYCQLPNILITYLNEKYDKIRATYDESQILDENEYDQIIEEEYNLLFTNDITQLPHDIAQAIASHVQTIPFVCNLVSAKTETKSKLFFSCNSEEFNTILHDKMGIDKLIEIIKTGYKLVIEIFKVSAYTNLDKSMNQMIAIKNKDPDNEYSKYPSIFDCLDHFSLHEKLEKGNEWYCSRCRKVQNAFKKMDLFYIPKYLVILLKRYETKMLSKYKVQLLKNNNKVKYPINGMNLTEYCMGPKEPKCNYDLYSVCQHAGSTEGGHYASACRNFGKWYEMDDASVFPSEEELVVSSEGYILFYRRNEKVK